MLCVSKKSSFFVFFLTQNMNTMYTAVSGIISYGRWHIQAAIAGFLINAVFCTLNNIHGSFHLKPYFGTTCFFYAAQ